MAWKPKTVAGKILKGVTIAAGVVGSVGLIAGSGGTAAPGIVGAVTGGIGNVLKGAGKIAKGAIAGADKVGTSMVNLVTGTTKEQRGLIKEQKLESLALTQKVNTIEKLIKNGATVTDAAAAVGLPLSSLAGMFGLPEADASGGASTDSKPGIMEWVKANPVMAGVGGLLLFLLLPTLIKGLKPRR